ncbi:MAG: hypothetical protein ACI30H_05780 [Paludibacteraceae bacterium]
MERDKSFELMTEEDIAFFEAFHNCKTDEEIDALIEQERKLNESRKNNDIPHLDMTLEEFCERYNCTKLDDIMKKYGF